jgi:hypothetical protein
VSRISGMTHDCSSPMAFPVSVIHLAALVASSGRSLRPVMMSQYPAAIRAGLTVCRN